MRRPRPAAGAAQHQIDHDPAGLTGRMIHRPHPVPPAGHPQESLLDQILGICGIPGHQVAGAEQGIGHQ